MTVHFIGAGPGAADLITLRGRDLIARCPVCLYAGSLVPKALLDHFDMPTPARLTRWRSLEALEQIATPEAMLLLETLAGGDPGARLTRDAAAVLERVRKR